MPALRIPIHPNNCPLTPFDADKYSSIPMDAVLDGRVGHPEGVKRALGEYVSGGQWRYDSLSDTFVRVGTEADSDLKKLSDA